MISAKKIFNTMSIFLNKRSKWTFRFRAVYFFFSNWRFTTEKGDDFRRVSKVHAYYIMRAVSILEDMDVRRNKLMS